MTPIAILHGDHWERFTYYADVAELADALDSGSSALTGVEVQVLSSALPFLRDLREFHVGPVFVLRYPFLIWGTIWG